MATNEKLCRQNNKLEYSLLVPPTCFSELIYNIIEKKSEKRLKS